uniref:Vacuolar protein sorting-associated protein 54 n=1 Tax=Trichuris muris TaxID=70415 RepID=A0A5S6R214_TRIMR
MSSPSTLEHHCQLCPGQTAIRSAFEFIEHLRAFHCKKEGGSYMCRYGPYSMCSTLPVEGVSDKDYEEHVKKVHLASVPFDGAESCLANNLPNTSSQPCIVQDSTQRCGVFRSTQNLSAVLNDPRRDRSMAGNFFVRHWGESFVDSVEIPPLYHVRNVSWKAFENYINRVAIRHRRHLKDQRRQLRTSLQPLPSSSEAYCALESELMLDVPKMFFSPTFSLEDPTCFEALNRLVKISPDIKADDAVLKTPVGWSGVSRSRKSQRANMILQEQLGHYLDKVEIEIANHLATKSQAFFQLMTFHDELQKQIDRASSATKMLREQMQDIGELLSGRWLKLISLQNRRARIVELSKRLDLISTVVQTHSTVQGLLNSSDYIAALELVSTTKAVLNEDLKGIVCFRHMHAELIEMENLITQMLKDAFLRLFRSEFQSAVIDDASLEFDQYELISIVTGLLRQREFRFWDTIKDEVLALLKPIVRQTAHNEAVLRMKIPIEDGQRLGDAMRQCNFTDWLTIFSVVAKALLLFCRRMMLILKCIRQLVLIASSRTYASRHDCDDESDAPLLYTLPTRSQQMLREVALSEFDKDTLCDALDELLPQICQVAEERLCRFIAVRGKEDFSKSLTSEEFVGFTKTVNQIDVEFQSLCVRPVTALRFYVLSMVEAFIQRFHDEKKTKLTNIIDSENWKRAEVPKVFQDIVNDFELTGKLRDSSTSEIAKRNVGYRSYLSKNGEKFVVVGTALMLLQIMAQYCQLVEMLPTYSANILTPMVDLLKMYNSRSCQLILGAGALQMVGLRTISSVHLALSCRSLQLIASFIHNFRELFTALLPESSRHLVRHFSQLSKDYEDHVSEIHQKLFAVLESCVDACFGKWVPGASVPSPAFQHLAKQVRRLHDNTRDILTEKDMQNLMVKLYNGIRKSGIAALQARNIDAQSSAPEYEFADRDFAWLVQCLQALPCCSTVSQQFLSTLT